LAHITNGSVPLSLKHGSRIRFPCMHRHALGRTTTSEAVQQKPSVCWPGTGESRTTMTCVLIGVGVGSATAGEGGGVGVGVGVGTTQFSSTPVPGENRIKPLSKSTRSPLPSAYTSLMGNPHLLALPPISTYFSSIGPCVSNAWPARGPSRCQCMCPPSKSLTRPAVENPGAPEDTASRSSLVGRPRMLVANPREPHFSYMPPWISYIFPLSV